MRNLGTLIKKIKILIVFLGRLFFSWLQGGENCIICGSISYLYPVCYKCRKQYFEIKNYENRCKKCGRELVSTKEVCSVCREGSILQNTNNVLPLFSYRLWNKELLFLWKIQEVREISFLFAGILNKALRDNNYEIIVPVPPRKGKIKKKGWDQIDELCGILQDLYGYKILKILNRKTIEEQKKLNREERLETIKSAYSLVEKKELNKELKKILYKNTGCNMKIDYDLPDSVCLIDDVCTTGATLESCSEILKNAGIKEVNVITLFIVD